MIQLCPYCAKEHDGICPRVAAINTDPEGNVVRVEFFEQQPDTPVQIESDDALRKRLLQVVGDVSINTVKTKTAMGRGLDEVAGAYGIQRRWL
jgi:hypothetical protein